MVGLTTQYTSDVIANVIAGETGWGIFIPTSTMGEYVAAGVTSLIPGSGLVGALARNIATEVIIIAEQVILNQEVNVAESVKNVGVGTVLDASFEWVADKAVNYINSTIPQNYSSYAHTVRQSDPSLTQQQIYHSMQRSIRVKRIAAKTTGIGFGIINECFKK